MEWIKHVIDHACMEFEINPDVGPMRRMIDLAVSEIYKEHLKLMNERSTKQAEAGWIVEIINYEMQDVMKDILPSVTGDIVFRMGYAIGCAGKAIGKEHKERMERAISQTRNSMIAEGEDGTT